MLQLKQARDAKAKALENERQERLSAKKRAEQEAKAQEAAKKKAQEEAKKERLAEKRRAEEAIRVSFIGQGLGTWRGGRCTTFFTQNKTKNEARVIVIRARWSRCSYVSRRF